jgi:amino acid adenylation domain-containing protein
MGDDLVSGFLDTVARHSDRCALVSAGQAWTYGALADKAQAIGSLLARDRGTNARRLGAVMGSRTGDCFAGLLGTLFSGAAYVPLSPNFPVARTLQMLQASEVDSLVIEQADIAVLAEALNLLPPLRLVIPDAQDVTEHASRLPAHTVFGAQEIATCERLEARVAHSADMAYLLFTSGSTGRPKGVMVSHGNVVACMDAFAERFGISEHDRFSQNFELTFDLSVFDMFLCWSRGASLFVAPPSQRACPAAMLKEHELTVWFSVPSMGLFMRQMGALKPDAFPSLRLCLFCGEQLTVGMARSWAKAAPASIVENLYGPTEVTIACTAQTFDAHATADDHSGVPIGRPLPRLSAAIVDAELAQLPQGEPGELCMEGPQVALGYWRDESTTAARFVKMPWDERNGIWYRTGDLAVVNAEGVLEHLGRMDDQVKIRGYRIELGEVELALRKVLRRDGVAAIAAPGRIPDLLEIVAFVAAEEIDWEAARPELVKILPLHMHPSKVIPVDKLPLNSNGKTDKGALRRLYEENRAVN